ncbi:hypothetical protein Taro_024238 [Colocasia esculenta]|uniref:Uncharacterized protein n=1 Tax=Colocasia esculenta TaxID=4460 RepID=A0A843VDX8_COLES|nr:hypothetical protein [Colocasia esculenta]
MNAARWDGVTSVDRTLKGRSGPLWGALRRGVGDSNTGIKWGALHPRPPESFGFGIVAGEKREEQSPIGSEDFPSTPSGLLEAQPLLNPFLLVSWWMHSFFDPEVRLDGFELGSLLMASGLEQLLGRKKPSMETISPERRFSPEFARESLIAISQSVPETTPPADVPPKDSTVVNVVEINGCSSEEYRSKLISIAYSESPDVLKTSPVPSIM